jgi:hypothetical protein
VAPNAAPSTWSPPPSSCWLPTSPRPCSRVSVCTSCSAGGGRIRSAPWPCSRSSSGKAGKPSARRANTRTSTRTASSRRPDIRIEAWARVALTNGASLEDWPCDVSRQGCRESSVPRKTRWAAGQPAMGRTGFPPAPGSRHRGSVGGHPRYGGRAACPPAPSDSPSLETHEGARRPALYAGTSARLAVAPYAPFLASVPHMGDNPTSIRSNRHPAFYAASQPPSEPRGRGLENDARSNSFTSESNSPTPGSPSSGPPSRLRSTPARATPPKIASSLTVN